MICLVALPYQAYQLSHSSLIVGLLSCAELLPALFAACPRARGRGRGNGGRFVTRRLSRLRGRLPGHQKAYLWQHSGSPHGASCCVSRMATGANLSGASWSHDEWIFPVSGGSRPSLPGGNLPALGRQQAALSLGTVYRSDAWYRVTWRHWQTSAEAPATGLIDIAVPSSRTLGDRFGLWIARFTGSWPACSHALAGH